MGNCYIYLHVNLMNNQIFYVGKGSFYEYCKNSTYTHREYKRAYDEDNRNRWWKNIVNKYGYAVRIVKENISEKEAFELEEFLIEEIGRKDLGQGTLVNLTDGGEGMSGYVHSEQTIQLWKKQRKGKKLSQEHKENIRQSFMGLRAGDKHPMYGKTGEKSPLFGKLLSEEHKHKISNTRINSKCAVGNKNPKSKKVINIKTKEIYNCAKTVAKKLKIKYSTFISMLNGANPNTSEYVFLKEDGTYDYKPPIVKRKGKIKVENIENGYIYESLSEAAEKENYIYGTLYFNINKYGKYKNLIVYNLST